MAFPVAPAPERERTTGSPQVLKLWTHPRFIPIPDRDLWLNFPCSLTSGTQTIHLSPPLSRTIMLEFAKTTVLLIVYAQDTICQSETEVRPSLTFLSW